MDRRACHRRPPALKDHIFQAEQKINIIKLNLSPEATCFFETPYFAAGGVVPQDKKFCYACIKKRSKY